MDFLNRLFDCCFRNKEEFKLHPNIDKQLEEKENSETFKEKEKSETFKEKEKSETIKEKEKSDIIKEKEKTETIKKKEKSDIIKEKEKSDTIKEKEKSETIDNIKEKKYSTTIKDKERNNSDNIKEKKYSTTIKGKDEDNNIKNTPKDKNIKDTPKDQNIKDTPKDQNIKDTPKVQNELTPIGSGEKNYSSLNATLQCLSNIKKLNEYFLGTFPKTPGFEEKTISYEYYKLIQKLVNENNNNKISYSSLIEFKEKLSNKYNFLLKKVEANSIDLIIFLLNELNSELNDNNKQITRTKTYNQNYNENLAYNEFISNKLNNKHNPITNDLFPFDLETIYQCNICQYYHYGFSIYNYIDFDLEKVNNFVSYYGMGNYYNMTNQKPDITLYQCFTYYNNYKELSSGGDKRFCDICNNLNDYYSQNIICSLPENLIIYLKRGFNDIYDCKVIFQEILDLNSFVKFNNSNAILELYAFICDINENSTEQHFVAYCKNQEDKRWYFYDGDFVSSCENPWENHKGMVYILFYKSLSFLNTFI